MQLQAHLTNNGGIRASSAGPLFPFIVFARGFAPTKWFVQWPDGTEHHLTYQNAEQAHQAAGRFKAAWDRGGIKL